MSSCLSVAFLLLAAFAEDSVEHGVRPDRLLIQNGTVIKGNGTPPFGPTSILVEDGRIARIGNPPTDLGDVAVIDATGQYVLPGFINMHGHLQESRGGLSMPLEYQCSLWLASGITTVRDVGSDFDRACKIREDSAAGRLAAPRVFLYPFVSRRESPDAIRELVRRYHDGGCDGLKIYSLDRDQLEVAMAEAQTLGLRTTTHIGVEETNAWDCVRLGMTSIEHWYGVPDAALDGVQNFPADFSYSNEVDRFRWAGRLWREVNPDKLDALLDAMIAANVAWDPTLAIYEASRDLTRAQNKPWFDDYLHPALERFFEPNLDSHGSYFIGWSSTDEVYWKENYRIWMQAVREFARRGGTVTTGEDAGFIYVMHGFGYLRELELQEEAGFHPLDVIRHATANGAKVLDQADRLGQVKVGLAADLVVVSGNPIENLRLLYPTGATIYEDGKAVPGGGIEWTVKDGIPYHGPTLMERVRMLVQEARAARETRGG